LRSLKTVVRKEGVKANGAKNSPLTPVCMQEAR
jgi:hypothetical protein